MNQIYYKNKTESKNTTNNKKESENTTNNEKRHIKYHKNF